MQWLIAVLRPVVAAALPVLVTALVEALTPADRRDVPPPANDQ